MHTIVYHFSISSGDLNSTPHICVAEQALYPLSYLFNLGLFISLIFKRQNEQKYDRKDHSVKCMCGLI